jgi:hypothetical protein
MSLIEYLREVNLRTPPTPEFGGFLLESSGAPDEKTSPFFVFYADSETGDVYWSADRSPTGWELAQGGQQLETDEARLRVTT